MIKFKLFITNGPQEGDEFIIDYTPISIGRGAGNNIQIPDDPHISRIHCTIYVSDETVFISDLNSTNGTYLNKTILKEPTVLNSSDKIYLGNTILLFNK